jgi:hypothetical protein
MHFASTIASSIAIEAPWPALGDTACAARARDTRWLLRSIGGMCDEREGAGLSHDDGRRAGGCKAAEGSGSS